MKLLPYARHTIIPDDVRAVTRVLAGALSRGPMVPRLEAALAEHVGVEHAVAFSSGTAALHAALHILSPSEVYTTTLTFCAVANAAHFAGAKLRLVDVAPATLCGRLPETPHVSVPMDYAGYPAPSPMTGTVVQDACHSLGGHYHDGTPVGARAHMTVFSFHPAKAVAAGEGGAVVTPHADYADALRAFRDNGRETGLYVGPGLNYHMDDMSAALALSQLKHLDRRIRIRREIARTYLEHWRDDERLVLPADHPGHAWHLFVVRVPERDAFRARLERLGVGGQLHYRPLHTQPFLAAQFRTADFGCANAAYERMLSIPLFPTMTAAEVRKVMASVDKALDG